MSKMKEKELLEYLHGHIPDGWKVHPAYEQIKEMIQGRAEQEEIEVCYMEIILDLYDRLEKKKPEIKEELIRKTARRIVEKVFRREYTTDNSQTQRIMKQMFKEVGVKVVKK